MTSFFTDAICRQILGIIGRLVSRFVKFVAKFKANLLQFVGRY